MVKCGIPCWFLFDYTEHIESLKDTETILLQGKHLVRVDMRAQAIVLPITVFDEAFKSTAADSS